jgi:hypothetical protein
MDTLSNKKFNPFLHEVNNNKDLSLCPSLRMHTVSEKVLMRFLRKLVGYMYSYSSPTAYKSI